MKKNFETKEQRLEIESEFKCPSCGANMTYEPENKQLKCDYCGATKKIEHDTNVVERDFSELFEHFYEEGDSVRSICCENCGATEIVRDNTLSMKCPFCDSPLVLKKDQIKLVKPDSIIPFAIDAQNAKQRCLQWLKKRFFAKKAFKDNLKLKVPNGIYYPIWTFDANTFTNYDGMLGKTYTVTRRDSKGNTHTETRIKWFSVKGTRRDYFDDMVINASSYIDDTTMTKLQPFAKEQFVLYSNEYLAGYVANTYTVDPYSAFDSAQVKMKDAIRQRIISHYNADRVNYLNMDMILSHKTFKSAFVPIYVTGAKFKEKWYAQYMNGATGKIVGKYPKSVIKILLTILLALGIIGGIILLLIYYGG